MDDSITKLYKTNVLILIMSL